MIDPLEWNSENFWKFARDKRASSYLCFGETGWGDQYAYQLERLRAGDPSIYFLDALAMRPYKIAADFTDLLAREFLPACALPSDAMTVAARQAVGELMPREHVAFSPSPVLGAPEIPENIVKLPSKASMIIVGDLAIGLNALRDGVRITGLEHYDDAESSASSNRLEMINRGMQNRK